MITGIAYIATVFFAGVGIIVGLVVLVYGIAALVDKLSCFNYSEYMLTPQELEERRLASDLTRKAGLAGMLSEEKTLVFRHFFEKKSFSFHKPEATQDKKEREENKENDEDGDDDIEAQQSSISTTKEEVTEKKDDTEPESVDTGTCSICLNEYENGDKVITGSSCSHMFHYDCCMQWLDKGHEVCPYCREPMLSETDLLTSARSVLGEPRVEKLLRINAEAAQRLATVHAEQIAADARRMASSNNTNNSTNTTTANNEGSGTNQDDSGGVTSSSQRSNDNNNNNNSNNNNTDVATEADTTAAAANVPEEEAAEDEEDIETGDMSSLPSSSHRTTATTSSKEIETPSQSPSDVTDVKEDEEKDTVDDTIEKGNDEKENGDESIEKVDDDQDENDDYHHQDDDKGKVVVDKKVVGEDGVSELKEETVDSSNRSHSSSTGDKQVQDEEETVIKSTNESSSSAPTSQQSDDDNDDDDKNNNDNDNNMEEDDTPSRPTKSDIQDLNGHEDKEEPGVEEVTATAVPQQGDAEGHESNEGIDVVSSTKEEEKEEAASEAALETSINVDKEIKPSHADENNEEEKSVDVDGTI